MFIASCNKGPATSVTSADPGDIVAVVNDAPITAAELDKEAKSRLQRVDQEIYQIKKDSLDEMVEAKLIEQAAAKQGKNVEEYLKENIDDKAVAPAEDEIKSFYEARKEQMGGKTLKDVEDDIKKFLSQSRKQGLRQQLISGLKASANVKIKIEPPRVTIDTGNNPSIGPKGAKIQLVEFTDYQCPFCGRVRPAINQLIDDYKDKLRYTLMDFPLSFHQYAKKAHEAAHCAGDQGKYWEYNKDIWSKQQALQVDELKKYAKELKLNTKKFDECLDSGKYTERVEENVKIGANAGAQGTPSFFINGIFLSGARPVGDFKKIIDDELSR
jgi:protein-disulfide isomerase